MHAVRSILR